MIEHKTILSADRRYRYVLWREWDFSDVNTSDWFKIESVLDSHFHPDDYAMFIGLNPSTADETKDDPTIRKCVGFAKRWGYGALCMCNVFAFRATQPKDMRRVANPYGLENQHHLLRCASEAGIVIAAWGNNGDYANGDLNTAAWLYESGVALKCLRKTGKGQPEHPLYVPYDTEPIPWSVNDLVHR